MTKEASSTALGRLQDWYQSNCDGDWEHHFGFSLESLDNPGWAITVDLDETHQEGETFSEVSLAGNDPHDWMRLKKDGTKLRGDCSALHLSEMLDIVANWLRPRPS
ncbi:hypothetical protein RSK20926_02379 [Roseobacter sp. SK209-2-6]|uniref:Imm53 family immunity protein n=1 Tax=Roseobacter sp. SK209-2-6 TaxID=388739 RepID=UPI0000F3EE1B|nr:Imm53 family immunity protein [Roseobacter sp. SK209-2-6]EBA16614.1 hypothetical protein RSK20926_02379 [Roseobacter sp. SK209-2-6]